MTALAATLFVVVLSSCGGGDGTTSQEPISTEAPAQTAEPPSESGSAPAGEMAQPQHKLEAGGYSVSVLSDADDLENVAEGTTIVATSGIEINGKGVHRAIGYSLGSPEEANALLKSIPGLASSLNGNRLYFVGERAPNAPFDRMVQVAEG